MMETTTKKERGYRAVLVMEFLRTHGPSRSTVIAAALGMQVRAVCGALTGLRHSNQVRRVAEGKKGRSWYVWYLIERPTSEVKRGITSDDLAWMLDIRSTAERRRQYVSWL